jgi:hypothetical protein
MHHILMQMKEVSTSISKKKLHAVNYVYHTRAKSQCKILYILG